MNIHFHPASPILRVVDLKASIAYFENSLGFKVDWNWNDMIASVSRKECNMMLSFGDQGIGKAWVYAGVGDCEKLFEEFSQSGARIRQKPTNFPWACEMQVEDLDGNVIRFGSKSKEGLAYGPWLDMNGKLWP